MNEHTPQPAEPDQPTREAEADRTSEHEPHDRPRIWAGSWLDYNNGILHGEWIDADQDDDALHDAITAMLKQSPTAKRSGETAEEWGIFDFDNFGPLRIDENDNLAWVGKVARGIAEHGLAYAAYADVMQDEQALDGFEDAYLGHYDNVEAYAEQLVDDLGYQQLIDQAIPDSLQPYVRFDTAALARDMQLGGDIHAVDADDGGVWLFRAE